MKLETRVFICFLLTLIFILCTGCHSTKWEWFPDEKDYFRQNENIKPPYAGNGARIEDLPPRTTTILKGSF